MTTLPVQKEFKYQVIGAWRNANPFVIAFIYPRKGNAYIVKGGFVDVRKYLKTIPIALVHLSYWHQKRVRKCQMVMGLPENLKVTLTFAHWPSENKIQYSDSFSPPTIIKKVRNIKRVGFYIIRDNKLVFYKKLRHAPRCWPKEIDAYLS